MNTQHTFGGLLLSSLLSVGLAAQDLRFEAVAQSERISARISGADEGDLAVMVLGMAETRVRLPGGQILGVEPDLVTGFAIADERGAARLEVRLPRFEQGFTCHAQAVSVSPKLPIERGLRTSDVAKLAVPGDAPAYRPDGTALVPGAGSGSDTDLEGGVRR